MPSEMNPSATVWMSPDGDDANPGTKEQPLATFSAAYAALPPDGGTVRLHHGTYPIRADEWPPWPPGSGVNIVGYGIAHRLPWWRRILRRPQSGALVKRLDP